MRHERPGRPEGTRGLADLVMRTAHTLRHDWSTALEPWDLSPHQARALAVVARLEQPRLAVLAQALRIAPRSATEVVDALAARGLVERTPDRHDRRAVLIVATQEGRRIRTEIDTAREANAERLFQRLAQADRTELERILRLLDED